MKKEEVIIAKVYKDKERTVIGTLELMSYVQQEEMKQYWELCGNDHKNSLLVHYSHYHRFLYSIQTFNRHEDIIGPSFEEYIGWKQLFPGWSYGPFSPRHAAYKHIKLIPNSFPMNEFYSDKSERIIGWG